MIKFLLAFVVSGAVIGALIATAVPWRLWCYTRHRAQWQIDAAGWGWMCPVDGIGWSFSQSDVLKITQTMKAAGREAARQYMGIQQ